jgi:ribosomal protein S19
MAIFVMEDSIEKGYSVADLKKKMGMTSTLTDQILTRYDFQDRHFESAQDLAMSLRADAVKDGIGGARETLDAPKVMGLKKEAWGNAPFFSQFKAIALATIGEEEFLQFEPSKQAGGPDSLQKEVAALRKIDDLGLRVVPFYVASEKRVIQKCIRGIFIDLQKRLLTSTMPILNGNSYLEVYIRAALIGGELGEKVGSSRESVPNDLEAVATKIMQTKIGLQYSGQVSTAQDDFGKLQDFMNLGLCIADLQGVLEFGTGKFYIIDPLAVIRFEDVKGGGEMASMRNAHTNITQIISFLQRVVVRR